jgi:hypothetical protein
MNESLSSPNGMERVGFARLVRPSALELILSPPVQASGGHMNGLSRLASRLIDTDAASRERGIDGHAYFPVLRLCQNG